MCKIDYCTLWRFYMKKFALILMASILAISLVACSGGETEDDNSGSVSDYKQSSHEHKVTTTDENDKEIVLGTLTFEDGIGNKAIISDYVGIHTPHEVTIPSEIGPKDAKREVVAIGKEAFYYCTAVTTVIIPEGVTSIGDYAFAGCTSLKNIVIPASVTSIGKGAFNGCIALEKVEFANGSQIVSIGNYAFNDCSALASITLPEGLESIGTEAFRDCAALTSFKTPASLKSIGDMAFYNCDGLNADGALDLSASTNITVTVEKVTNEATGEEEDITTIAIGEFAFGNINKYFIVVPTDATTGAAQYVAAMKEPDGTDEPDDPDEESSEESSEEASEESSEA